MPCTSSRSAGSKSRMRLDALKFAHKLWEALDTPLSLGLHLRAKHKCFADLVAVDPNPRDYLNPEDFYLDYQASKLLSQYPFLDTGTDLELAGVKKFLEAEVACRKTNERFRSRMEGVVATPRVEQVLLLAQRKIAFILGDVPSLDRLDFSFGPGANFGVRGDTSVLDKVNATLECTYAFSSIVGEFLAEFPGWINTQLVDVSLVRGSELTFVPKNAKTHRPICIEPLLNGLYQKGVGSYIRDRLSRHGVKLRDQTINQRLAKAAFYSDLSTVDFSSASDTIAYGLVMDLLPVDWFEFLEVARSPNFCYKGNWYPFEKFTSMGNAYTFELETLIFYAIASAVCEVEGIPFETGETLHVYGDDVVIPRGAFDLYAEVVEYCGFTLNLQKTFREGVFYESCGCDYFQGWNVRPYRLKRRINQPLEAIYAANTVRRIALRLCLLGGEAKAQSVLRIYPWVVAEIPEKYRHLGPEGHGDGHLIANLDEATPRRDRRFDGWRYRTVVKVPRRKPAQEVPSGFALYGTRLCSNSPSDGLPFDGYVYLRGGERLSVVVPFCHEWHDWHPPGLFTGVPS
jgi:hypothetical protein